MQPKESRSGDKSVMVYLHFENSKFWEASLDSIPSNSSKYNQINVEKKFDVNIRVGKLSNGVEDPSTIENVPLCYQSLRNYSYL